MAKRKEHIQTDAPQQAQTGAGAIPQEAPAPPPLPDLTVRVFPISNSKSKLRATANVNIAGAFAVRGFRIFDSRNGLFVKEPEQSYIKDGTELTRPVFFPVTKEAREALYGQILHSYELTMQQGQRQDETGCSLSGEDAPPERNYAPLVEDFDPEDDLPFEDRKSTRLNSSHT